MKKIYTLTLSLLLILNLATAQVPQGFKYQTAIRDNNGAVIANKLVAIKLSLLTGSANGTAVYSEVHKVATNDFGVANLNVGNGTVSLGNFSTIDWGSNTFFLKTEVDINNGTNFAFMGSSQLLSVPFAMYAAKSANAADDKDKDTTNELQQLTINNNNLQLNKNGGSVDLSKYDKDSQQLVLNGNTLSITKGNSIVLSGAVDLDADPTNEIQNLSLSKDTLKISKANYVLLPKDNDADSSNEIQSLTYRNDSLFLSKANFVNFIKDNDRDSLNELQLLSRSNDTIFLSKGNYTVLPKINTVPSGSIITLENYDSTLLNNGYSYWGRSISTFERKISDSSSWQWDAPINSGGNSPEGMYNHFAIWTGNNMIICGVSSISGCQTVNYNSNNNTWTNISPSPTCGSTSSKAVWTGNEILVHNGGNRTYKYNPISNIWTTIDSSIVNTGRSEYSAIWTGTDMIIWGGQNSFPGQKFNLATKTWSNISTTNSPTNKRGHSAIWTGSEMLIWGGIIGNFNLNSDSTIYKYNPITNSWTQVVGINSPKGLYLHSAVWTGTEMIVFGGQDAKDGIIVNKSYRYNYINNTWFEMSTNSTSLSPRFAHSAIYTGNEILIWGGYDGNGKLFNEGKTMKLITPTYGNTINTYLHLFKKK